MPAHKKIQPTKQCRVCPNTFSKPSNISSKMWDKRETCSKVCGARHKNPEGSYVPVVKFCKNPKCREPFIKDRKDTYEHFTRQEYCCISCGKLGKEGELNNSWKGDDVGYQGVHTWMKKVYGKPSRCDFCEDHKRRMFHWANISGEYKRDRSDWYRLCVSCHRIFDLGKLKK